MSAVTLTDDQIAALKAAGVELPASIMTAPPLEVNPVAPAMTQHAAPAPVATNIAPLTPPPGAVNFAPTPPRITVASGTTVSERIAAMQTAGGGLSLKDALSGLDGSKATSRNYRLLAEDYDLEAQIVKASIDNEKGKPRLRLELLTTFPAHDAGVTLYDDIYLTQAALFRFKGLCEACEMWEDHAFSGASEQEFVGSIVRFRVKTDVYNPEKPKSKINGAYSAGRETPGLAE